MYILVHFCVIILGLYSYSVHTFFLFAEKNQPIWLCLKICPLYCPQRRHDEDASLIYWDDFEPIHEEPEFILPYHYFCKPKPKSTTTPKPTTTMATTTPEPTWICEVCMKKCGKLKTK